MLENTNKGLVYQSIFSQELCEQPIDYDFRHALKDEPKMSNIGRIEDVFNEQTGEFEFIEQYDEINTVFDEKIGSNNICNDTNGWIPYYIKYIIYEPVYSDKRCGHVSYYIKYAVTEENIQPFLYELKKSDFVKYLTIYQYTGDEKNKEKEIYYINNWTYCTNLF